MQNAKWKKKQKPNSKRPPLSTRPRGVGGDTLLIITVVVIAAAEPTSRDRGGAAVVYLRTRLLDSIASCPTTTPAVRIILIEFRPPPPPQIVIIASGAVRINIIITDAYTPIMYGIKELITIIVVRRRRNPDGPANGPRGEAYKIRVRTSRAASARARLKRRGVREIRVIKRLARVPLYNTCLVRGRRT